MAAAGPLLLASTALQGFGALQQGRAESQALTYQAQVAENNAKVAEQNAQAAIEQASMDAMGQDQVASQEIGQIIAEATGSGLVGGSVDLRAISARRLAARDRLAIIQGGANQARDWRQRGSDMQNDASFNRSSAGYARTSSLLNFTSSLISGASTYNRNKIMSLSLES